MIPLTITREARSAYNQWWTAHKEELEKGFLKYLSKKKRGDWIKAKYRSELRAFLIEASHEKCAYCERRPNDGGSYIEIEHFLPKDSYRDKVFDLDNLLPSCKECNTVKGAHANKDKKEMLNPFQDKDLSNHLEMDPETLVIQGTSPLGKTTILKLQKALNGDKFPLKVVDEEGKERHEERKGALGPRKEAKRIIEKKLKFANLLEDPKLMFLQLQDLLEMISPELPLTATYAGLVKNSPLFVELTNRISEKDPDLGKQLRQEAEAKSAFSLCPKPT